MAACFDWSIDQVCEQGLGGFSLPDDMRHHLIIQRFCNRVTKAMLSGPNGIGLPLEHDRYLQMMLLEEEINVIGQRYEALMSGTSHGECDDMY